MLLSLASLALVASQNRTILLESLKLSSMTQGWGQPMAGKSVDNHDLSIAGQKFASGVGTHAVSEFTVVLAGNALRFSAKVGVDDEIKGGSVVFQVWVDQAKKFDSGVMHGGDSARDVSVDLAGARKMRLVVTDAGDGIDYDHADWAVAAIEAKATGPAPMAEVVPVETPMKIAAPNLNRTQINGARVLGTTPGKPFVFKIPASGREPITYSATGLPAGLMLDKERGVISGKVAEAGTYKIKVVASGKGGSDHRTITIMAGHDMLGRTPPMGWNSWNVWATSVDANKVRAAGDSLIKTGLAGYGFAYTNIDDAWEGGRDAEGNIQTNEKFGDMGALADYIHSLGLKLGIYSSPGPKTCAGYEASYQHEQQDANSYAKWGIDYLKYDWCSYGEIHPKPDLEELEAPYIKMKGALEASDRDIFFSLCQYGMGDVYNWGRKVGGNCWRTTGDITDTWQSMSSIAFSHSPKAVGAGPGGWNDPDMLVVGRLGWGPNPRPTRLTPNEQITHIGMWAMLGAPLILGCDLTQLDSFTKSLLMNHDIIEVDQDPLGKVATLRKKSGDLQIWARPLWDGTMAVALANLGRTPEKISCSWKLLGLDGEQNVRDLWQSKNLGMKEFLEAKVPGHGTMIFKIGTPNTKD